MGGSRASHFVCGTCARSRLRIQYTVAAQSNRKRSRGPAALRVRVASGISASVDCANVGGRRSYAVSAGSDFR